MSTTPTFTIRRDTGPIDEAAKAAGLTRSGWVNRAIDLALASGTALAASSVLTVILTNSEPAIDNSIICFTLPAISVVSVLVIDCTTIGAPPPTWMLPTRTGCVCFLELIDIEFVMCKKSK